MYSALISIDIKNIITYKADKTHKSRFSEETQKAFVETFTGCFSHGAQPCKSQEPFWKWYEDHIYTYCVMRTDIKKPQLNVLDVLCFENNLTNSCLW